MTVDPVSGGDGSGGADAALSPVGDGRADPGPRCPGWFGCASARSSPRPPTLWADAGARPGGGEVRPPARPHPAGAHVADRRPADPRSRIGGRSCRPRRASGNGRADARPCAGRRTGPSSGAVLPAHRPAHRPGPPAVAGNGGPWVRSTAAALVSAVCSPPSRRCPAAAAAPPLRYQIGTTAGELRAGAPRIRPLPGCSHAPRGADRTGSKTRKGPAVVSTAGPFAKDGSAQIQVLGRAGEEVERAEEIGQRPEEVTQHPEVDHDETPVPRFCTHTLVVWCPCTDAIVARPGPARNSRLVTRTPLSMNIRTSPWTDR